VIGKAAIQLGEQADQLKIITIEHGRRGVTGHAVAGVNHNPERPDARQVNEGMQMFRVRG
jgi:hypothetical protein